MNLSKTVLWTGVSLLALSSALQTQDSDAAFALNPLKISRDSVKLTYSYTTQIGAYVQGRFEIENGFNLSTGARYDANRFADWDGNPFGDTRFGATLTQAIVTVSGAAL